MTKSKLKQPRKTPKIMHNDPKLAKTVHNNPKRHKRRL